MLFSVNWIDIFEIYVLICLIYLYFHRKKREGYLLGRIADLSERLSAVEGSPSHPQVSLEKEA